MIACPECDGRKAGRIAERHPCRKPDLDRLATCAMDAAQARRQGRSIICNDQVARAEEERKIAAQQVLHRAVRTDGDQLRGSSFEPVSLPHGWSSTTGAARFGSAPTIVSIISAAETSGRLRLNGSASGIARAWRGVSKSPGSIERKRTPQFRASSAQIAVKCRRAALLAP